MTGSHRLDLVVHELRSPVAALAAIAETMRSRGSQLPPPERLRLSELAVAAVANIERLIVDASIASVEWQTVDPAQIVRDAAEAATLAGAQVRVEIGSGVPRIPGDPVRLRQAIDNILANAVAHSPPGAATEVSASASEAIVLIAVTDAGAGVSEDERERIFQPGVRLAHGRPGQGLGLAIARAVAEAHGGTLDLDPSFAGGSRFRLVLPRASVASD